MKSLFYTMNNMLHFIIYDILENKLQKYLTRIARNSIVYSISLALAGHKM